MSMTLSMESLPSLPGFLLGYSGFLIDRWRPLCFSGIVSDCTIFAILPSVMSRFSAGSDRYCYKTPYGRLLRRNFAGDTHLADVPAFLFVGIGIADIGNALQGRELILTETLDGIREKIEKDESHTIRTFLTLPPGLFGLES
jgi:hypothetical protein